MPIIDPDGYFGGDRFDMVSDSARMVWPSFFLASNTVARLELNYYKVIAKAFYKWKKKPTEAQFWAWVQEFRDAYLLFVYETEDGQPWGQWDTSEKFLVTYKLAADLRSPAPVAQDFLDWKKEYISSKKYKSIVPTNFRNISKTSKGFSICSDGNGNGVGGGKGKTLAADAAKVVSIDPFESELEAVTERIHERHPAVRSCGPQEIKTHLRAIAKRHGKNGTPPLEVLATVDANHEAECASEQWAKSGGEYAKGLSNWLAPTQDRYMSAKARDSPGKQADLYSYPPVPKYEKPAEFAE